VFQQNLDPNKNSYVLFPFISRNQKTSLESSRPLALAKGNPNTHIVYSPPTRPLSTKEDAIIFENFLKLPQQHHSKHKLLTLLLK
jgi:hypothetical protein